MRARAYVSHLVILVQLWNATAKVRQRRKGADKIAELVRRVREELLHESALAGHRIESVGARIAAGARREAPRAGHRRQQHARQDRRSRRGRRRARRRRRRRVAARRQPSVLLRIIHCIVHVLRKQRDILNNVVHAHRHLRLKRDYIDDIGGRNRSKEILPTGSWWVRTAPIKLALSPRSQKTRK